MCGIAASMLSFNACSNQTELEFGVLILKREENRRPQRKTLSQTKTKKKLNPFMYERNLVNCKLFGQFITREMARYQNTLKDVWNSAIAVLLSVIKEKKFFLYLKTCIWKQVSKNKLPKTSLFWKTRSSSNACFCMLTCFTKTNKFMFRL